MIRNRYNQKSSKWYGYLLVLALILQMLASPVSALADTSPADEGASSKAPVDTGAVSTLGYAQITGGLSHTVALKSDGTVWTWGDSLHGKLGTGPNANRYFPTQVKELFDITAVSAGMNHTLALRKDGTVWAWGQNTKGQIGDGTLEDRLTPFQIEDLRDVAAVAAGNNHSVALKRDGTVVIWGDNSKGQLGDKTTYEDKLKPSQMLYPTGIKAIASGGNHVLAVNEKNMVMAWGDNTYGQLGENEKIGKTNWPTIVSFTEETKTIAAGSNFSALIKEDGTVWTWGYNSSGQLGNGNDTDRPFPAKTIGVDNADSIALGNSHAVVLRKDGTVVSWGLNNYGQLGLGDYKDSFANTKIAGLTDVALIGAGHFHSMAIKKDGTVLTWGNSLLGQLGDGAAANRILPVIIPRFSVIVQPPSLLTEGETYSNSIASKPLASGDSYNLLWKNNKLWAWGENVYGQLGLGAPGVKNVPAVLNEPQDITIAAAGTGHALALKKDGTVWAWGNNLTGQLADKSTNSKNTASPSPLLDNVTDIAGGNLFTIALKKDGTVWGAGDNTFGQMVDSNAAAHTSPVQIPGLMRIKAIAAGYNHALALASDGTVWTWGDNSNGQLGDGTTAMRRDVWQLADINNVKAIAAGRNHSLALKSDGTVWSWGYNAFGQLGTDSTANRSVPVKVNNLDGVTAIAAGSYHSLAAKSDGTVWAWGFNAYGQLGDDSTANRLGPVQVKGIRGAAALSAGSGHSAAMSADGMVWTWGSNMSGQLGDGTFKNRTVPGAVTGFVRSFGDTAGHWAESAIAAALEKGYVDGYPDGTFQPGRTVLRAEFAKLTAAAFKLPVAAPAANQAWYMPYAAALIKAGYIAQEDAANVNWEEPITRVEMAKIAVKAVSKELQTANTAVTDQFAMQTAVKKGILQGLENGSLAPQDTTIRAQAVTIIERLLTLNNGGTLPVDELALKNAQAQ